MKPTRLLLEETSKKVILIRRSDPEGKKVAVER
jgi:hypothetical protein